MTSAGLGVAGVDGEERGTAAARRRSGARMGARVRVARGGEGEGKRSTACSYARAAGGPGVVRRAGRWPRRHGAAVPATVAHSDEGLLQKKPRHLFCFSVLILNMKTAPFRIYLRQQ